MSTSQEKAQNQASQARKGDCQIAIIGDEDSVTGFLLAGIGSIDRMKRTNFLIVDNKTQHDKIAQTFNEYVNRTDIAIVLITQNVADSMRDILDGYDRYLPVIMEIPCKDHPYNPDTDSVMVRLKRMTGRD
ncbi:V-type ATPase, F subunit, putative [Entamoeba histolytica HM-1:IMSS-B]|uniref:V-type proton ATPase subunit F n=8 Tax=Entamoeba TaxID=5758 RepID=C4LYD1_ENTH1|nr:V-type ATPase, F subunit protein [Entamoeba nuttalli P19]XP_654369.1 V-type ATPase, F subunit, putative [Entamoeba histolytica HM-1:IMSS]EMD43915.1 Vtype ATPase F subunit, putative [Entamoeba histolytica KU27]EMH77530.1 V-type ATPase, F subunit, putative [Entamoeba histolytica HM-1:IMSS-B]EMS17113.1 V-type ATPase, F subunit [Entamoeba histolytica HM-3:IMSS]ENY64250.1 V-type ATPase, F subunit, putative [Entamoeba histolytica HM-1:IMSS-A]GAT93823.1 v-type ATPase f subunit putative [Entamoeba|eukprot:XP_008855011.1 V-type ATPase, F subunit protein [Entamoeba nuttalli P19]